MSDFETPQKETNQDPPAEAQGEINQEPPAEAQGETNQEPPSEAQGETVNLRVASQDGNEVFFKIKKTTTLSKLIAAYLSRQGVGEKSLRFLFDGNRIRPDQTPKELGMEENDVIDAVLMQTGGCFFKCVFK